MQRQQGHYLWWTSVAEFDGHHTSQAVRRRQLFSLGQNKHRWICIQNTLWPSRWLHSRVLSRSTPRINEPTTERAPCGKDGDGTWSLGSCQFHFCRARPWRFNWWKKTWEEHGLVRLDQGWKAHRSKTFPVEFLQCETLVVLCFPGSETCLLWRALACDLQPKWAWHIQTRWLLWLESHRSQDRNRWATNCDTSVCWWHEPAQRLESDSGKTGVQWLPAPCPDLVGLIVVIHTYSMHKLYVRLLAQPAHSMVINLSQLA